MVDTDYVTPEYLDQKYIDIYNLRFNTLDVNGSYILPSKESISDILSIFGMEIAMYLRTNGVDVTKVETEVYGALCAALVRLELHGKHAVAIRILAIQREEPPILKYEVVPGDTYNVYGTKNLPHSIHRALGYYYCKSCHYASGDTKHCGLGLEMYTQGCIPRAVAGGSSYD